MVAGPVPLQAEALFGPAEGELSDGAMLLRSHSVAVALIHGRRALLELLPAVLTPGRGS